MHEVKNYLLVFWRCLEVAGDGEELGCVFGLESTNLRFVCG